MVTMKIVTVKIGTMDREYEAIQRLTLRIIFNNDINLSPRQSQGEGPDDEIIQEQRARLRQRRFGVVIRPEVLQNMDRFTRYYL